MSSKGALVNEATEILAKKLNISKQDVLSDYFKKYKETGNSSDMLLKDAGIDVSKIKEEAPTKEVTKNKEAKAKEFRNLTEVVSGVSEKDLPPKTFPSGPIGAVASPSASASTLTDAVGSGTLPVTTKDPLVQAMIEKNTAAGQVTPGAVGEIQASGKHKGKLVASGLVAAGAGGAYMAGKGPNKESPQSPEMVAQAMEKQAFKNKALVDVNKKAGKAKTPKDWNQILAEEEARIAKGKEGDTDPFADKLRELSGQLKIAEDKYEKDKDRTAWSEVAEKLGFAFAQIGAGLHGLNTGVDVTGVKFNPTNWEARYDRSLAELKNSTGNIQKGIEQVQGEKKDVKTAEERKNEQAKGRLFDEYMSAKKITADAKQNQLRLAQELEIAKMNNEQKTVKSLEKEKSQVEKEVENRLKTLMEIRADLQAASDDELDKPIREQAKKNFADNLRKLGKADLLEQIREKADDEKWGGSDFGAPTVLKLLDVEIEGVRSLIPNAATSPGQGPSGKVTFRFKPTGETKEVKSSAADKYRNDPNFEIISGE